MDAMARNARVVTWNGKDVPAEMRELPAGRYVVAPVEDEAPVLSPEQEAGLETALESYRQALDRGVPGPEEAHLNRGVIYTDCLGQPAAAAREFESALALNPRYVPALLNLGNLREDLGDAAAAAAAYERILALEPHHPVALARYASLRTARGPDPGVVARLRDALACPGLDPADRATLGFALAGALDKTAEYDAAFAAASDANRESRRSADVFGIPRYDPVAHERFVDALIEASRVGQAHATSGVGGRVEPIFVCGMFRSGSTLVEQLLAGHPRVAAGGEIDFLPRAVQTTLAPFPASMSQVSPATLTQLATQYLDLLERRHPGAGVVVDKRPDNFLYIGLVKALFPRARIVHTVRDPLDNCLSVYFLHLDPRMAYALDLRDTAHYYGQYRRLMAHWKSLYGEDIHDVDYDRLVREPRPVVAELLEFCGLDWSEDCLTFTGRTHAVRTASVWQVRQPLYRHASGRSAHYARHLEPLRDALAAGGTQRRD